MTKVYRNCGLLQGQSFKGGFTSPKSGFAGQRRPQRERQQQLNHLDAQIHPPPTYVNKYTNIVYIYSLDVNNLRFITASPYAQFPRLPR